MNNLKGQQEVSTLIANAEPLFTNHGQHITGPYCYTSQVYERGGKKERVIRICKTTSGMVKKIEKEICEMFHLDDDGSTNITEATAKRICDVLNALFGVSNATLPVVEMLLSTDGAWANLIMYSHKLAVENQELKDWKAQAELGHKMLKTTYDEMEKSLEAMREELLSIRKYINANPEESTYDEVVRHFEKLKNSK